MANQTPDDKYSVLARAILSPADREKARQKDQTGLLARLSDVDLDALKDILDNQTVTISHTLGAHPPLE